jgi:uncharacterized protein (UPF0332 family)
MTPEERERYQAFLIRADEEIQTVRDNIDNGHYHTAVSRAYYAMFYAATAILLTKNIVRSKHSGVSAAFGRDFVRTGEIDPMYHRLLLETFHERTRSDYNVSVSETRQQAETALQNAKNFVSMAKDFLEKSVGERFE